MIEVKVSQLNVTNDYSGKVGEEIEKHLNNGYELLSIQTNNIYDSWNKIIYCHTIISQKEVNV